jgi:hypothetical protein
MGFPDKCVRNDEMPAQESARIDPKKFEIRT